MSIGAVGTESCMRPFQAKSWLAPQLQESSISNSCQTRSTRSDIDKMTGEVSRGISFLDLPGEIRNQIYREYFYSYTTPFGFIHPLLLFSLQVSSWENIRLNLFSRWDNQHPTCMFNETRHLLSSSSKLYRACRQILHEARSLFHNEVLESICLVTTLAHYRRTRTCFPEVVRKNLRGVLIVKHDDAGRRCISLQRLASEFGFNGPREMKAHSEKQIPNPRAGRLDRYFIELRNRHLDPAESYGLEWVEFGPGRCEMIIDGTLGKLRSLSIAERRLRRLVEIQPDLRLLV
jgi:hypothetical protein